MMPSETFLDKNLLKSIYINLNSHIHIYLFTQLTNMYCRAFLDKNLLIPTRDGPDARKSRLSQLAKLL